MLKLDHKVVIGYTTINVIGVTTVFVKNPIKNAPDSSDALSLMLAEWVGFEPTHALTRLTI